MTAICDCTACGSAIPVNAPLVVGPGGVYCNGCAPDTTREEVQVSEGEGLGERLEWLVELSRQSVGGPRASKEALAWCCDGYVDATDDTEARKLCALLSCAIRELAGQRHELRREVAFQRDRAEGWIESCRVVRRERDAAIARAEAAEAELARLLRVPTIHPDDWRNCDTCGRAFAPADWRRTTCLVCELGQAPRGEEGGVR